MNVKHKISRSLQRLALKLMKLLTPKEDREKSDYEIECLGICKTLIKDERSKLMMSPISRKRYITSHDKQIFIIIENGFMTIVNHHYSYNIDLPNKTYTKLVIIFDNEMESRRMKMESEIKSNVKHSLKNIYKNIVNEKV
jgi:hypothetical protein